MSKLLDYLHAEHATTSLEDMAEQMMESFGVSIRNEGDLFQFKYNMIAAKWLEPVTHECRGAIVRRENGKWTFVTRPFDKFFNQSEGHCPYFDEKIFNANIHDMWLAEKADGTCIQVWYDHKEARYRASTLGTITPFQVYDFDITFDALFSKTLGVEIADISEEVFDKGKTYIFELCAPENRILTQYATPKVFLLGIRDNLTGAYGTTLDAINVITNCTNLGYNISSPKLVKLSSTNISSLQSVRLLVEDAIHMVDIFGKYPEGFVIYKDYQPVAKMKNSQYLSLHGISGGDHKHTKNVVIASFFNGTLDDIYDVLVDTMRDFADSLRDKVAILFTDLQHAFKIVKSTEFASQKDYALCVMSNVKGSFVSFFFTKKDQILNKNINEMDLFTDWLKLNYSKFDDYWKKDEMPS